MTNLLPEDTFGNPWMANLVELESPPAVPWWPPAPGWFVVAGLVAAAICWVAWKAFGRWQANAYRREALKLLRLAGSAPPDQVPDTVATVLKRVAITTYGRERVATLAGQEWINFLDTTGCTTAFSEGAGVWLTDRRYAGDKIGIAQTEREILVAASAAWVRRHRETNIEQQLPC